MVPRSPIQKNIILWKERLKGANVEKFLIVSQDNFELLSSVYSDNFLTCGIFQGSADLK